MRSHFGVQCGLFFNKHTFSLWHNSPTSRYLPRLSENLSSQKNCFYFWKYFHWIAKCSFAIFFFLISAALKDVVPLSTSLYFFLRGPLKLFLPCMYFFHDSFSPSKMWFYLYFKIRWKFCIYLRLSLFLVYITLSLMTGFVLRSPFSSWMSKWGNAYRF